MAKAAEDLKQESLKKKQEKDNHVKSLVDKLSLEGVDKS